MLRDAGFGVFAKKKNPFIQDRVNAVNSALYQGIYKINKRTCPESVKALEQQAYDKKTGKPEKSVEPASPDDWNDSIGYPIAFKYPIGITNESGGHVMPVDQKHKDYEKWEDIWQRCRDASAGQDAVHDAGETYLPRLFGENNTSYAARVFRTLFYEATGRTISGLSGMLFRKTPELTSENKILSDVDLSGTTAFEFMEKATKEEAMEVNRFGILVDYPSSEHVETKADAELLKLRPYMNVYKTESIINWWTGRVKGVNSYTKIVLSEMVEVQDVDDEFIVKYKQQYRVLDIDDGKYRVRIFEKDGEKDIQIGEDVYPKMNGKEMDFIPFYIYPDIEIVKPALLGMINVNMSHYNTTSSHENGCHISGLPTLFVSGYRKQEGENLYVGGGEAQVLPDAEAKAEYVGVESGFTALEKNLERKENMMAVLGSRMLQTQKKAVETEGVAAIHRAGEAATLTSMSILLSKTFTRAFQTLFDWAGISETIMVTINDDFNPYNIKPEMVTALLGAVQAGKMSDEAFFNNLKEGELYKESDNFVDEQAKIDNQTPVFGEPI
jgi:hypothetical protein